MILTLTHVNLISIGRKSELVIYSYLEQASSYQLVSLGTNKHTKINPDLCLGDHGGNIYIFAVVFFIENEENET
jgi:hypothetical protein